MFIYTHLGEARPAPKTQSETKEAVSKCAQGVKWDTKEQREESTKQIAECAADAYCAGHGIPPGICSKAAGPLASAAIQVWNSIFGDDKAEKERARRLKTAEYFAALDQAFNMDRVVEASVLNAATRLIQFNEKLRPSSPIGGGKLHEDLVVFWPPDQTTEDPLKVYYYDWGYYDDKDTAMDLLARHGAYIQRRLQKYNNGPDKWVWQPMASIEMSAGHIRNTQGKQAAINWLKTAGLEGFKYQMDALQVAEGKARADLVGLAAADLARRQRSSTSSSSTATKVVKAGIGVGVVYGALKLLKWI